MSRWISQEAERLAPYTPGEQPQDQQYIKLNTNESPFPPSPRVLKAINRAEILKLNLYSDPACAALTEAIARRYELKPENVLAGNGSDEVLAFAFRAFCGAGKPVAYADITYGFYKSQAALFGLDVKVIPLREDFTLNVDDYMDFPGTIVIANPNAPTGMAQRPHRHGRAPLGHPAAAGCGPGPGGDRGRGVCGLRRRELRAHDLPV